MSIIQSAYGKSGKVSLRTEKRLRKNADREKKSLAECKQKPKFSNAQHSIRFNLNRILIILCFLALVAAIVVLIINMHHLKATLPQSKVSKPAVVKAAPAKPTKPENARVIQDVAPHYPPLMGIMMLSNGDARAIFDNQMYAVGDKLEGDVIVKIYADHVSIKHNDRIINLAVSTQYS